MDTFEQAKAFFLQGIAHYEAGRFEQAQRQFEASLSLVPQRASTLTNLGATRVKLGRFADAAVVLEEATRLDPSDAPAWGHRALALAETGRHDEALRCADEALERDQRLAAVWTLRGTLLREMGRTQDAIDSFRQALAHGGDTELNAFYLAALGGAEAPDASPSGYVRGLFDGYADGFESHLVAVLRYRAPEVLARGLCDRHFDAALDVGCGTGLVGEHLRGRVARLVGVDLSQNMVERSRARGVYDEVVLGDVAHYLRETQAVFDLVVAADVFIYVGRLEQVFAQVRRALAPGGTFCFTVELAPEDRDVTLQPSLRYAHSRDYVETLARSNGFGILKLEARPVREEQRRPIPGLFAWLKKA